MGNDYMDDATGEGILSYFRKRILRYDRKPKHRKPKRQFRRRVRIPKRRLRIRHRRMNLTKWPSVTKKSRFDIMLVCFHISPPSPATSNLVSQQRASSYNDIACSTTLISQRQCSQTFLKTSPSLRYQTRGKSPTKTPTRISHASNTSFLKMYSKQTEFTRPNIKHLLRLKACHSTRTPEVNNFTLTKKHNLSPPTNGDSSIPLNWASNPQSQTNLQISLKGELSSLYLRQQRSTSTRTAYSETRTLISLIGTSSKFNHSWQISFTQYLQSILSKRPPITEYCGTTRLSSGLLGQDQIHQHYRSRHLSTTAKLVPSACPPSTFLIQLMVRVFNMKLQIFCLHLISPHRNSIQSKQDSHPTIVSLTVLPHLPQTQLARLQSRKEREIIHTGAKATSVAKIVGKSTARFRVDNPLLTI